MDKNLSWFLGPKAENASTFEDLLHVIVNDCFHWRKNYFPDDPLLITKSDQRDFDEEHDKLYQNVHEFLAALRRNFPFYNPRYIAHMLSDVTMPSLLGYIGGLLYNPNNVTTEAAPVTTEWEIEACNQILEMIGFKKPPFPPQNKEDEKNYKKLIKEEFGWAHIASGGSLANIEALWVARCVKYLPLSIQDTIQNKLPDLSIELKSPSGDKIVISGKETCIIKKENGKDKKEKYDEYHLINIKPSESIYLLSKYIQAYVDYVNNNHSSDIEWKMDIKKVSKEAMDILKESPYSLSNNMGKLLSEYPLAIFVSGTAHYSIHKAADLLGIGRNNIKFVDIDSGFRMDINKLKEEIEKCYTTEIENNNSGKKVRVSPLAVIGIVGTTEEGAIDPVHKINDIRREFEQKDLSFWVHVDSAWGGYCKSILQLEDEQILRIKLNKVLGLIDLISKSNLDYYKDIHEGTENIKNSINDIIKRKNGEVLNDRILKEIAAIIPELFDKDGNFSENQYNEYYKNIKEDDQIIKNKVNQVLGLLVDNKRLKIIGYKSIVIREGLESIRDCIIVEEILYKIAAIIPELFDKDDYFIEDILDDYSKKVKEDDQIIIERVNQVLELLVKYKCLNKNGIAYIDIYDAMDSINNSIDEIIHRKRDKILKVLKTNIPNIGINLTVDNIEQYRQKVKDEYYLYQMLNINVPFAKFREINKKILASLPDLLKITNKPRKYKDPNIKKVVEKQLSKKKNELAILDQYSNDRDNIANIETKIKNDIFGVCRHIDSRDFKSAINNIPRLFMDLDEMLLNKIYAKKDYKKVLNIDKDDRVKEFGFYTNYMFDISFKDKKYGPIGLNGTDDNFVCSYLDFKNADSVTIDPHKMGYIPYPCGVIAFKNDRIRHLIAQEAPYITSSNNDNALVHKPPLHVIDDEQWENSNEKRGSCIDAFAPFILEGSKPGAAAASLWLTNKCIPLTVNGYGKIVRDSLLSARALYTSIKKWNEVLDSFDISASYEIFPISRSKPDTNIVVFAVKRKFIDSTIDNVNDLTNKIYQKYSLQVELGNREYSYGQPFFLSKTTFSYPTYSYAALSDFFDRAKIKCTQKEYKDQGLIVLRATLMNPYLWAYKENKNLDFINDFMINMHNELEELHKEEKLKRESKNNNYLDLATNEKDSYKAFQLFNLVIHEMPDSEVAYIKRGDLKAKEGDIKGALDDYSMAISIKPDEAVFYNKRANTYLALGMLEEAFSDANKAIKKDDNYQYHNTKGAILMAKRLLKGALKEFDKALLTHNDFIDALEKRIECCRKLAEEEKEKVEKEKVEKKKVEKKKVEKKKIEIKALLAQAEADEKRLEALKNNK